MVAQNNGKECIVPPVIEGRPTSLGRRWKQPIDVRVGEAPVQHVTLVGSSTGELKQLRKAIFVVAVADDMIGRLMRFSITYNDVRPLIRQWRDDRRNARQLLKANGVTLKTRGG